ncbi:DUF2304 domain-containing protein [Paenibacillus terrigena]|uniref:DUF2304 domain-containing protein n=1 Tax=Paenibacillus terrigena TaxID=369333 RepID=UPI000369E96B|nr:DUF2304 domain-containing protein [Paenibacillus terrigena]
MLPLKLQLILIIGALLCLFYLINLIRKYKLELKYSMLWLAVVLVIVLLALFPSSFVVISKIMGIEMAVNALFLVSIFFGYVLIFSLTITLSRSSMKIKELTQEVGLIKNELLQLKKEMRAIEREAFHK